MKKIVHLKNSTFELIEMSLLSTKSNMMLNRMPNSENLIFEFMTHKLPLFCLTRFPDLSSTEHVRYMIG